MGRCSLGQWLIIWLCWLAGHLWWASYHAECLHSHHDISWFRKFNFNVCMSTTITHGIETIQDVHTLPSWMSTGTFFIPALCWTTIRNIAHGTVYGVTRLHWDLIFPPFSHSCAGSEELLGVSHCADECLCSQHWSFAARPKASVDPSGDLGIREALGSVLRGNVFGQTPNDII